MADRVSEFREELVGLLPRLRKFARALAGSRDGAEDLLQSAIERALTRSTAYDETRRLDSWMFKIMQNLWIDSRRAIAQAPIQDMETPDVQGEDGREIVESREELRLVREAFAQLPDEQRAVMALVVLDGASYAEAAAALDIPIGTVMSRLARARASVATRVRGPALLAPLRKHN
ncbi:MAG: sigma-70 family RNA polymerase sigma factor [Terricaulis sp.]